MELQGDENLNLLIKSRISRKSESNSIGNESRVSANKVNEESSITESSKVNENENESSGDQLIETENAQIGSVAFGVYLRYFKSIGVVLIAIVLIFTLSSEASSVLSNRK